MPKICKKQIYTINITKESEIDVETGFDYTGDVQTFVAPKTGTYKLETWGAQGGKVEEDNSKINYGGYSTGLIKLWRLILSELKKENINVKIADKQADISGGFILKYGSIEYNLSLDAIIDEKKELLEDKINTILFFEK